MFVRSLKQRSPTADGPSQQSTFAGSRPMPPYPEMPLRDGPYDEGREASASARLDLRTLQERVNEARKQVDEEEADLPGPGEVDLDVSFLSADRIR